MAYRIQIENAAKDLDSVDLDQAYRIRAHGGEIELLFLGQPSIYITDDDSDTYHKIIAYCEAMHREAEYEL